MYRGRHYDDPYEDYEPEDYEPECDDPQCYGCQGCIRESEPHVRTVIARKARYGVKPGDRVRVETGFTYQINGPRRDYYKRETIKGYGPNHEPKLIGTGYWPEGVFASKFPEHAEFVESRDKLYREARALIKDGGDLDAWEARVDAWEAEHGVTWERAKPSTNHRYIPHYRLHRPVVWTREHVRKEKAAQDAHRARREQQEREAADLRAMREAVKTVEDGATITYKGEEWTVGPEFVAMHYFSSMEYYGHLCDGESRVYRRITNTKTGASEKVQV